MYGQCPNVKDSFNAVRGLFGLKHIPARDWSIAILLMADKQRSRLDATITIIFCEIMWLARDKIRSGYKICIKNFANYHTTLLAKKYCPCLTKKFLKDCDPIHEQAHGSAGSRSKEQSEAAIMRANEIIKNISDNAIIAFTDGGTHMSNPGPCGGGIFMTHHDGKVINTTLPIGWGTNNLGELIAIGEAIFLADSHNNNKDNKHPIHILTDSYVMYGVLMHDWSCKTYPKLARAVRRIIHRSAAKVTIDWIAGHAGILGNETADDLAT